MPLSFVFHQSGEYLAFAERFKVFVTPFVERGKTINIAPDNQFPIEQLSVRAGENIAGVVQVIGFTGV